MENFDPTVDVVEVYVLDADGEVKVFEFPVDGEREALQLFTVYQSVGVMVTIPSDGAEDDPHALWDNQEWYPPHRVLKASYLRRNSKPRPPEEEDM